MNQLDKSYANFIESVRKMDKIKSFGKNAIMPLLVLICLGHGAARGASDGSEFNKCYNTSQCVKQINDLKTQNKITPEQVQEVKRLAENDPNVELCKIFPSGILCKRTPIDDSSNSTMVVYFTPTKHIDDVPDDVYSITFANIRSKRDGSMARHMSFSTGGNGTTMYQADAEFNTGKVLRYDEFSGLTEEKYSYQSVLNFINQIYDACKH